MTKSERLAALIHLPVEIIENDVDRGMWDILIELNKKNYFTSVCCEGHLREDGTWNGYIGFKDAYNFAKYPKEYDNAKKQMYFYWNGKGEESRQKFLSELLEWAKSLAPRELKEVKMYTLYGTNKRSGKRKVLVCSYDYKDIKIEYNKKSIVKYDTELVEKVVRRY